MFLPVEEDLVNHPPHYRNHPSGVECIEIKEWLVPCLGDALKYLWRRDDKGKFEEDVRKARWYVNREIERMETYGRLADHPILPGFVQQSIDKWMMHEPPSAIRSTILLILNGRLPSLEAARNRLDEIIATFDSEKEQTYA